MGELQTAEAMPAIPTHHFRGRYVKPERSDSVWRYIPDTPEALAAAICRGAMFSTWCAFSREPGQEGEEPTRFGDLPLDFDHKDDPGEALKDLRRLCLFYLPETFDIDPWDMQFYASGSKGFHCVIPARFFGTEEGDPYLPLIYKRLVYEWADELGLKTLDRSMYAMSKGKMFRLPNVRRSNGKFKVPISRDDIGYAAIGDLLQMCEEPQHA